MQSKLKDWDDVQLANEIRAKMANLSIPEKDRIYDRVYKNQPFVLSLILGFYLDIDDESVVDEITKIFFGIYLHFEKKADIKKMKIPREAFLPYQMKSIAIVRLHSENKKSKDHLKFTRADMESVRSKALFAYAHDIVYNHSVMASLPALDKFVIALGAKCLIECFEEFFS